MRSIVLVLTFVVAALAAPDPFGYPDFGHRPGPYYYGPRVTGQAYRYGDYRGSPASGQTYYGDYPEPSTTEQSNSQGPNNHESFANTLIASTQGHFTRITLPPGISMRQVSANRNYLWGIDSKKNIYMCPRPCAGNWQYQSFQLKQLDVDESEVWGVDGSGKIYKRSVDGTSSWQNIPPPSGAGAFVFVSATGDGYILGVDDNSDIYKCKKPCSRDWKIVGGSMTSISGSRRYAYGLNSANQVSIRPVDGSGSWKMISSTPPITDITAAGVDNIYGVSDTKDVYRCDQPCQQGMFVNMGVQYSQCDATTNALFCVDSNGNVDRMNLP